jgi:protein tyrosine/serine phosphatase
MTADRHLDWDGCYNVRDLGGLRTIHGRTTRWGAVVRADAPDRLTPAGWSAVKAYGIRTIIDLRNDEERPADTTPHAAELTTVHVPLDDPADLEFWQHWRDSGLWATPLYYRPFLDRKPQRCAAAVAAVAHAQPGGVLVHCGGGRDRTGLITLLVLALIGVAPDDIATDYELSIDRLRLFYARAGRADASIKINELLARENTSARAAILATLASLDADAYLRTGGLTDGDLAAVRARLLGPEEPEPARPPAAR